MGFHRHSTVICIREDAFKRYVLYRYTASQVVTCLNIEEELPRSIEVMNFWRTKYYSREILTFSRYVKSMVWMLEKWKREIVSINISAQLPACLIGAGIGSAP